MKVLRRLVLLVSVLAGAWQVCTAQVFPSAVATDANLLVAANAAQSTLSGAIDDIVTSFEVASASNFVNNMVLVIGSEQIFCSTLAGTVFSGCTRGYDGTTPASHGDGSTVSGALVAAHHNNLKDEIIAIQTELGSGMSSVVGGRSNLTTAGRFVYVSTSGTVTELPQLVWDTVNNRLQFTLSQANTTFTIQGHSGSPYASLFEIRDSDGIVSFFCNATGACLNRNASIAAHNHISQDYAKAVLHGNDVTGYNLIGTSGGLLLSSDSAVWWADETTAGNVNYSLRDFAIWRTANGTIRFQNPHLTVGPTTVQFYTSATQGDAAVTTWSNVTGTIRAHISGGDFTINADDASGYRQVVVGSDVGVGLATNKPIQWRNNASEGWDYSGAISDVGIRRNQAYVFEIYNPNTGGNYFMFDGANYRLGFGGLGSGNKAISLDGAILSTMNGDGTDGADFSIGRLNDDDDVTAGYGNKLYFRGGGDWATYDSDNSDPIWLARYNAADDTTELRLSIGDDVLIADKLSIGSETAGPVFTELLAVGGTSQAELKAGSTLAVLFDGALSTKPFKSGTTAPATCVQGEAFFDTDAAAGENLYLCTSTNNWTQIVGSGGGGSSYNQAFTGQTSVTLTHNLNTLNTIVSCYDGSEILVAPSSITGTDANNTAVTFAGSTTGHCVVLAQGPFTPGLTSHADLTDLDYASAGHTGFAQTIHVHAGTDITSGTVGDSYLPTGLTRDTENQAGGHLYCAPASASGTTYTCGVTPALTGYTTGQTFVLKPDTNNTASATLNIDSLGAITMQKLSSGTMTNLAANDLDSDAAYMVIKLASVFLVVPLEGGGGAGGHTIEDEGVPLTARTNLNFTGAGVSCADSGGKTVCTINTGAGGGVSNPVAMSADGTFSGERVLTADLGVVITDNGADSTVLVGVDPTTVMTMANTNSPTGIQDFTGSSKLLTKGGSGSLPATCTQYEQYLNLSTTNRICFCVATNTWQCSSLATP